MTTAVVICAIGGSAQRVGDQTLLITVIGSSFVGMSSVVFLVVVGILQSTTTIRDSRWYPYVSHTTKWIAFVAIAFMAVAIASVMFCALTIMG